MPHVLLALIAAAQPALPARPAELGRTAWIVATVGHSEWCPAGNVRLDLVTGRYDFTARASRRVCGRAQLERPVTTGRLGPLQLQTVRAAYLRVLDEGLESEECRDHGPPSDHIIVSNGGTPVLVVTDGGGTGAAPDNLTCWSEAASALHRLLDHAFSSGSGLD